MGSQSRKPGVCEEHQSSLASFSDGAELDLVQKSGQNEEIIHDMSVICILVATGMRCPPQGNPEPGTAGDHK